MRYFSRVFLGAFMVVLMEFSACCLLLADGGPSLSGGFAESGQLLVAAAESSHTSLVRVYAIERTTDGWKIVAGPFPGMIGRNGFAPPGAKREGDGCTPSGHFPLESAFGYAPSIDSRLPYRQATENDLWVDDVQSPQYNTWVRRGRSSATSFEEMKRNDNCYRHGAVIGYNRNPVVSGCGSAIFLHVWKGEGVTTTGCVALDESALIRLLAWLDPARSPRMVMGTRDYLATVEGLPPLLQTDATVAVEAEIRAMAVQFGERSVEYRTADGFFGMAMAVPAVVADEMRLKKSWKEGCPVKIAELSYLLLSHWGFDGRTHAGELVVHKKLALATVKAFADLFAEKFPIERMERIEKYDGSDDLSMAANNTSAFNCRDITGKPGFWSTHSYGGAIDINPLQNPYIAPKSAPLKLMGWDGREDKGAFLRRNGYDAPSPALMFCTLRPDDCLVLPPGGAAYRVRARGVPGLLLPETRAVTAFTDRGFDWGGAWQRLLDYQHFEYDVGKLK